MKLWRGGLEKEAETMKKRTNKEVETRMEGNLKETLGLERENLGL